jgi:hypothetical protein
VDEVERLNNKNFNLISEISTINNTLEELTHCNTILANSNEMLLISNNKIQESHDLELNDFKNNLFHNNENMLIKNNLDNETKTKELTLHYIKEVDVLKIEILDKDLLTSSVKNNLMSLQKEYNSSVTKSENLAEELMTIKTVFMTEKTMLVDKISIIETNLKLLSNENNDYHFQINENNLNHIDITEKYDDLLINYDDIKSLLDIEIQKYMDLQVKYESMISANEISKKGLDCCVEKYDNLEKCNSLLLESHKKLELNFDNQKIDLSVSNENHEKYRKNNENEKNDLILNINEFNLKFSKLEEAKELILLDNQDLKKVLQFKEHSLVALQTKFDGKSNELQCSSHNKGVIKKQYDDEKIMLEVQIGKLYVYI